jgi:predicted transposase YbfD/YdcC
LIVLRSERTVKKTGATSTESRYYLSSALPQEHAPHQWLALIRGHWGGVEIRNHWRRDVLMGEDRSRSRNANLLANLALLRSALLTSSANTFKTSPSRSSEKTSNPIPDDACRSSPNHDLKTKDPGAAEVRSSSLPLIRAACCVKKTEYATPQTRQAKA